MSDIQLPATPALMSVEEFARWHGIGPTTVRQCIDGTSANYPPLRAKRNKPGKGGRLYITAEAAAEWRASLPDA
ncbi:hypothetical protein EDD28_2446 [Salana multivorans]|uniref:Helix-turn-helix protein n=1 Tax=Salana multivorans TaxID=120377 RepID=A0A3N2D2M7_9MICO|nr:hypothetical protein [Salana multivorans]ROR94026.1 hypothetical protein EDD28_3456 [Salana multivorans]ROR97837.1 hypothetical protein EDD28_2446 [Salana multivorans]